MIDVVRVQCPAVPVIQAVVGNLNGRLCTGALFVVSGATGLDAYNERLNDLLSGRR